MNGPLDRSACAEQKQNIKCKKQVRGERGMRAAVSDFVEILAIGLFVAGIGAMGAALHAVA